MPGYDVDVGVGMKFKPDLAKGFDRRAAGGIDRDTAIEALRLLDRKLSEANRKLTVILIGGGVMMLEHGTRLGTRDLDVIPQPPSRASMDLLEQYRDAVTREMEARGVNLPVNWINAQAAPIFQEQRKYFPPSDLRRTDNLTFRNLDIIVAAPEALLAMKVQALRDSNDWNDVQALCRILAIRSWEEFLNVVEPRLEDMGIIGNDDILKLKGMFGAR